MDWRRRGLNVCVCLGWGSLCLDICMISLACPLQDRFLRGTKSGGGVVVGFFFGGGGLSDWKHPKKWQNELIIHNFPECRGFWSPKFPLHRTVFFYYFNSLRGYRFLGAHVLWLCYWMLYYMILSIIHITIQVSNASNYNRTNATLGQVIWQTVLT